MKLEEADLGKSEESKRELIRSYMNRDIILNDKHKKWCHGRVIDCSDDEVYTIRILDDRGKTELFYHDLQMLLTIGGNRILPQYSLGC